MNIDYSYILAVPARSTTVDAKLMELLANQMDFLNGKNVAVLAMPEGKEVEVTQTAELLVEKLKSIGINARLETRQFDTEFTPEPSGEATLNLLERVFDSPPEADCLVIVADLIHSQRIPGIVLFDYLNSKHTIPGVEMLFQPGEAGVVDCKSMRRDVLHPEGNPEWLFKSYMRMA